MARQQDQDDQQGPLLAVIRDFLGLKNSAPRQSIGDNQFSILNNAMPTDNGNLQSIPGHSASLFHSSSPTLSSISKVVRNNSPLVILFFSDGSAKEFAFSFNSDGSFSISPGTVVGAAGTFSSGGTVLNNRVVYPGTCDWNNTLTLIIDPTKGYFSWDGTTRTLIDNTILGYTIAAHQGRAWIGNGRNYTCTGTNGYNDKNVSRGFATFPLNGDAFIGDIEILVESVSYLYVICASGIGAIGTVQFTSSLNYFQLQPLLAGTGAYPGTSVIDFDGLIFYAHTTGIYALTGPQPQYVSYDIRNTLSAGVGGGISVWQQQTYSGSNSGLAYLNGVRMPWFMIRSAQAVAGVTSSVFAFFPDAIDENAAGGISAVGRWFTADDVVSGTSLGIKASVSINRDGMPYMLGITNTDLYGLFCVPTANLNTTIQSKLYDFGNAIINKDTTLVGVEGTFQNGTAITITADSETASEATGNSPITSASTTNIQQLSGDAQNTGKYQGMTITFTSNQWQISGLLWEYQEGTTW